MTHTDSCESLPISTAVRNHERYGEKVDVLDLFIVVASRWKRLAWASLAGVVVFTTIAFLLPKAYEARCSLLPPQQPASAATLIAGQLSSIAGVGAKDLGLRNSNELYLALLRSESVAGALIERFDLGKVYGESDEFEIRRLLARKTTISLGKEGVISVNVRDRDARRAADLANAYAQELQNLCSRLALTEAAQRRLFYAQQLKNTKEALAEAEAAVVAGQRKTGIVDLGGNTKALVEQIAIVRAQLAAKEVEQRALRSYATEQNPDLQMVSQQAEALRQQLGKLEAGPGEGATGSTGKLTAGALEYTRALREFKYQEALFELLSKQLAAAQLDEARNGPVVQVIDTARPPRLAASPNRLLIICIGALLSAGIAFLFLIFEKSLQRAAEDPSRAWKLQELRRAWKS